MVARNRSLASARILGAQLQGLVPGSITGVRGVIVLTDQMIEIR